MAKTSIHTIIGSLPTTGLYSSNVLKEYQNALDTIRLLPVSERKELIKSARTISNDSDAHKKLKHLAHLSFDPFWQQESPSTALTPTRSEAYTWLNGHFGDHSGVINARSGIAHMSELNAIGCLKVISICDSIVEEKGSLAAAQEEIHRWNNTVALSEQLSTRSIVPPMSEVRDRKKREETFTSDPTQKPPATIKPITPKKEIMSRAEAIEFVNSALEDIQSKIESKKRLSKTQTRYIQAITEILEENKLAVPEARKDRIIAIQQDENLLLKITGKVNEIERNEQREKDKIATLDEPIEKKSEPLKPEKDYSHRTGSKKPSYVPAPHRSKASDPFKAEQNALREKEQEEFRKRYEQQQQERRSRSFEPKPLTEAELKARELRVYRDSLSHMSDRALRKEYDNFRNEKISLTSKSGAVWHNIPISLCEHGPTIHAGIFGIIPRSWKGVTCQEPGQSALPIQNPEAYKGQVLEITEAEYKKFSDRISQLNKKKEILKPILNRRSERLEIMKEQAREEAKIKHKVATLHDDLTDLFSSQTQCITLSKCEPQGSNFTKITFRTTLTEEFQRAASRPGMSENKMTSMTFLKMMHDMGIVTTSFDMKDSHVIKRHINASRHLPQMVEMNGGRPLPSYDEMVQPSRKAGHTAKVSIKNGGVVTLVVDNNAAEKIHAQAQTLRHSDMPQSSTTTAITEETPDKYSRALDEQHNASSLSYITGEEFTGYVRHETNEGMPIVDAVLTTTDKMTWVMAEVALRKAGIAYSKETMGDMVTLTVEDVNTVSENNLKITQKAQEKHRIEQRINRSSGQSSSMNGSSYRSI